MFSVLVKRTGRVRSVYFFPNCERVVSRSNDFKVVIRDVKTSAILSTLNMTFSRVALAHLKCQWRTAFKKPFTLGFTWKILRFA